MPEQKLRCIICGSRFAEKKCYFCENRICTSCIVPFDVSGNYSTTKCLDCDRKGVRRVGTLVMLKRNFHLIAVIVAFWLYAVFPVPFMHAAGINIDASAFQPVLITTAVMTIPFVLMFLVWQKKAPRGYQ